MSKVLDHVAYLSQEIGPRPAGTEEEQQAALYIADTINQGSSLTATIEDFSASSNKRLAKTICAAVALVAGILSLILSIMAIPGLILAILAAVLFVLEWIDRPVLSKLFKNNISQNVVAKYEPDGATDASARRRKVILVTRYDSGKARTEYQGGLVGMVPLLSKLALGGMIALPVLLLVKFLFFRYATGVASLIFIILTILALVCVFITVLSTILENTAKFNEAANSNAAGVAVMLDIIERVGQKSVDPESFFTKSHKPIVVDNGRDFVDANYYEPVVHGEDAARESGYVPEDAELVYSAAPIAADTAVYSYDENSDDPAERLMAAKAAIAALTGRPMTSYEPVVKPQPAPAVSAAVADEAAEFAAEAEDAAADAAAEGAEGAAVMAEVDAALGAEGADGSDAADAPAEEVAQPAPLAPAAPAEREEASNVPSWFTAGKNKARKSDDDESTIERSRFADAFDNATAVTAAARAEAEAAEAAAAEEARRAARSASEVSGDAESSDGADQAYVAEDEILDESPIAAQLRQMRENIQAVKAPQFDRSSELFSDEAFAASGSYDPYGASMGSAPMPGMGAQGAFAEGAPQGDMYAPAAYAPFGSAPAPAESLIANSANVGGLPISEASTGEILAAAQSADGAPVAPIAPVPPAGDSVFLPQTAFGPQDDFGMQFEQPGQFEQADLPEQAPLAPEPQAAPIPAEPEQMFPLPAESLIATPDTFGVAQMPAQPPAQMPDAQFGQAPAYGIQGAPGIAPMVPMAPAAEPISATARQYAPLAAVEAGNAAAAGAASPLSQLSTLAPIGATGSIPSLSARNAVGTRAQLEALRTALPSRSGIIAMQAPAGMPGGMPGAQAQGFDAGQGAFPDARDAAQDAQAFAADPAISAPIADSAGSTMAFAPVTSELAQNAQSIDDLYVDDAEDSEFAENFTASGAPAGPGYMEMPKRRGPFGKLFKRGKDKEEPVSTQDWLQVDEDFNAQDVGRERGSWESFRGEGAFDPNGAPDAFSAPAPQIAAPGAGTFEGFAPDNQAAPLVGDTQYLDMSTVQNQGPQDDSANQGGRNRGRESDPWADPWNDDWNGGAFSKLKSKVGRKGKKGDEQFEGGAEYDDADDARYAAELEGQYDDFGQYGEYSDDGAPFDAADDGTYSEYGAYDAFGSFGEYDADAQGFDQPFGYEDSAQQSIREFHDVTLNTEVWFVALGSQLDSNAGMKAFLAEHKSDLRGAMIIELDSLGAGELCTIEHEGLEKKVAHSSRMKRFSKRAAQQTGLSVGSANLLFANSASSYANAQGFQTMHIAGIEGNKPALFAQMDDVIENVSEEALYESSAFVIELLKGI